MPVIPELKEDLKVIFNGPKAHEEMLNIPGHKGYANQNLDKIPPHSCCNDIKNTIMLRM
jgi:hypothetical protein